MCSYTVWWICCWFNGLCHETKSDLFRFHFSNIKLLDMIYLVNIPLQTPGASRVYSFIMSLKNTCNVTKHISIQKSRKNRSVAGVSIWFTTTDMLNPDTISFHKLHRHSLWCCLVSMQTAVSSSLIKNRWTIFDHGCVCIIRILAGWPCKNKISVDWWCKCTFSRAVSAADIGYYIVVLNDAILHASPIDYQLGREKDLMLSAFKISKTYILKGYFKLKLMRKKCQGK